MKNERSQNELRDERDEQTCEGGDLDLALELVLLWVPISVVQLKRKPFSQGSYPRNAHLTDWAESLVRSWLESAQNINIQRYKMVFSIVTKVRSLNFQFWGWKMIDGMNSYEDGFDPGLERNI